MENHVSINGIDGPVLKGVSSGQPDPHAPYIYKTICLRLNQWESERLDAAAEEADRTRTDFVRWAMHRKMLELL